MTLPLRKLFLIFGLITVMGCGSAALVTAHTSIATGCATAATYAGTHDAITVSDLDKFQGSCNDALSTVERWHALETSDAGVEDGGRHD